MTLTTKTQKFILPPLILITPFLVFLNYNSYCFSCAETWIAIGGLVLLAAVCAVVLLLGGSILSGVVMAALITAFIDLQFTPSNFRDWANEWMAILLFAGLQTFVLISFLKEKFYAIATAVFLTFFVVTVFQLAFPSNNSDSFFAYQQKPAPHAPPRIIHLILDEHIGIEGIPTDIEGGLAIKDLITKFYLRNGFQLFGGAYSHYFNTHISIPNMLNFSGNGKNSPVVAVGHGFKLTDNQYFKLLSEKNYHIEVLTSGFLDFCLTKIVIAACQYDIGALHAFAKLEVPTSRKLQILVSRYLTQSSVVSLAILRIVSSYESLRPWTWAFELDRTRLNSLSTLLGLRVLWNDIATLPRGNALFAHLMIPHSPYVANADCSIRPPSRDFLWNSNNKFESADGPTNTVASRRERYKLYFEQLRCLYSKLDELFDRMRAVGVYDNSIILLHGDHGSRIVINEPTPKNQHALTNQDLVDGFSTLFAMKIPGKVGKYDKSPRPLEQLFAKFVFEAGLTSANIRSETSQPYVYLLTTDQAADSRRILYVPRN